MSDKFYTRPHEDKGIIYEYDSYSDARSSGKHYVIESPLGTPYTPPTEEVEKVTFEGHVLTNFQGNRVAYEGKAPELELRNGWKDCTVTLKFKKPERKLIAKKGYSVTRYFSTREVKEGIHLNNGHHSKNAIFEHVAVITLGEDVYEEDK